MAMLQNHQLLKAFKARQSVTGNKSATANLVIPSYMYSVILYYLFSVCKAEYSSSSRGATCVSLMQAVIFCLGCHWQIWLENCAPEHLPPTAHVRQSEFFTPGWQLTPITLVISTSKTDSHDMTLYLYVKSGIKQSNPMQT